MSRAEIEKLAGKKNDFDLYARDENDFVSLRNNKLSKDEKKQHVFKLMRAQIGQEKFQVTPNEMVGLI